MTRGFLLFLLILCSLVSCNNRSESPDVSGIQVDLQLVRFERDFFSMDTTRIRESLAQVVSKHNGFAQLYTQEILGIPDSDSSSQADEAYRRFLHDYRLIYESVKKMDPEIHEAVDQVREGLRYTKHYFPNYDLPQKMFTFIGPLDAFAEGKTASYGDIITPFGLGVGMHLHLGAQADIYTSEQGEQMFPRYLSRRFDPSYIAVNCMKNVVDDLYPGRAGDRTLLDHMVDKGKRLYLLDLLMPEAPDTLKIGYTEKQLEGAREFEGLIWNHFVTNGLLFETDQEKIRPYISEGPMTPELGTGSPGYIGLFTGYGLVREYMRKNPEVRIEALLQLGSKDILEGAKYKPR